MASCSTSRPAREVGSTLALSETRRLVARRAKTCALLGDSSVPAVRRRQYWRGWTDAAALPLGSPSGESLADVDGMLR
jgi:hypothetical protein